MGEQEIITLHCIHCENDNCKLYPNGVYIFGKEGCTRIVEEDDAAHYQHYTQEVLPFWKHYSWEDVKKSYIEISIFLDKIYSSTLGGKLDKYGKLVGK